MWELPKHHTGETQATWEWHLVLLQFSHCHPPTSFATIRHSALLRRTPSLGPPVLWPSTPRRTRSASSELVTEHPPQDRCMVRRNNGTGRPRLPAFHRHSTSTGHLDFLQVANNPLSKETGRMELDAAKNPLPKNDGTLFGNRWWAPPNPTEKSRSEVQCNILKMNFPLTTPEHLELRAHLDTGPPNRSLPRQQVFTSATGLYLGKG